jgi:DNA polymerase/3'-5' exonuclease PolX
VLNLLSPFCSRIEIAGSIRRECHTVKDIEILCIPKIYFSHGKSHDHYPEFIRIVDSWQKIKGNAVNGKYMQRILPEGIVLDLFTARPDNWGLQMCIRTGSVDYSKYLAKAWVSQGYNSENATIIRKFDGKALPIHEEEDLFRLLGIPYLEPKLR